MHSFAPTIHLKSLRVHLPYLLTLVSNLYKYMRSFHDFFNTDALAHGHYWWILFISTSSRPPTLHSIRSTNLQVLPPVFPYLHSSPLESSYITGHCIPSPFGRRLFFSHYRPSPPFIHLPPTTLTASLLRCFANSLLRCFAILRQVVVLCTVIVVSIYYLTSGRGDSNMWTALLSSSLGYLFPNPSMKPTLSRRYSNVGHEFS